MKVEFFTPVIEGHSSQRKQHMRRPEVESGWSENYEGVLVSSGRITKYHRPVGSNNRDSLSHSSGGLKSKIKVSAGYLLLRVEGWYWVGQKVGLGFSIRCYGKTQTNFLAKPISLDCSGRVGAGMGRPNEQVRQNDPEELAGDQIL